MKIDTDWLRWGIVSQVVAALGADHIRFVGGAVRDTLIGKPVIDIDAATTHRPERTVELLEAAGIRAIPTGLQHGTITAVVDDKTIEITTLRVDVETDGRHAEVSYTDNWLLDAERRDFTFNALYLTIEGELYDPFDGIADLKSGQVRFIGNAEERIQEDALRIMRYFRFSAHYGQGSLDRQALEACKKQISLLKGLSIERIRDEFLKLLKAKDPLSLLVEMKVVGAFESLGLNPLTFENLEKAVCMEDKLECEANTLARFYYLFHQALSPQKMAKHFKLSTKDRNKLVSIHHAFEANWPTDKRLIRQFIYKHGIDACEAIILQMELDQAYLWKEQLKGWTVPQFPVQGRDLIEKGFKAGPELGVYLKSLEEKWISSDFSLSRKALLATITRH